MKSPKRNKQYCSRLGIVQSIVLGTMAMAVLCLPHQLLAASCQVDGPDRSATEKYIHDALTPGQTPIFIIVSNFYEGKIYFFVPSAWVKGDFYGDFSKIASLINGTPMSALDCGTANWWRGDDGHTYIGVECKSGSRCSGYEKVDEDFPGRVPDNAKQLFIRFDADPDRIANMVRALSHYVYLCQQEYQKKHADPNDPFAPK